MGHFWWVIVGRSLVEMIYLSDELFQSKNKCLPSPRVVAQSYSLKFSVSILCIDITNIILKIIGRGKLPGDCNFAILLLLQEQR